MEQRNRSVRRVLTGLLFANLLVVMAKLSIGLGTGSLAVLGDGIHASVDVLNNVIALAVMRVATAAPDDDHPYGHGKFETLGALLIVGFLSVSCFELIRGAVSSLATGGQLISLTAAELGLLVGTLVINVLVAWYEEKRGRELHSELLLADAGHTKADVFITSGVLVGLMASRGGLPLIDPLVALAVSVFIIKIAWDIVRRSVPVLVDERARPSDEISDAAQSIEGVARAYRIRSRGSGTHKFAELTIAVDGTQDVHTAHDIADRVESRLIEQFGMNEVVVHVEPEETAPDS